MSARKLASLVVRLIAVYMILGGLVSLVNSVLYNVLMFDTDSVVMGARMRYLQIFSFVGYLFIFLIAFISSDRIAAWAIEGDWMMDAGPDSGGEFWRRTIPILSTVGIGIVFVAEGLHTLAQNIPALTMDDYSWAISGRSRTPLIVSSVASMVLGTLLTFRPAWFLRVLRIERQREVS